MTPLTMKPLRLARTLALGCAVLFSSTHVDAQRDVVPALDLAFAASDLVAFGHADVDAFGRPAIRVLERLSGSESSTLLPQPGGARLGLHVSVPAQPTLLFLQKQPRGRAYRPCQHPGSTLAATPSRKPRLRALVQAFALVRIRAIGAAQALVSFAEREALRDPQLARVALRALARRGDLVAREAGSGLATRFATLLGNTTLAGGVRAEAACCLASLDRTRARATLESLLVSGRARDVGKHVGPLFSMLVRERATPTLRALLARSEPGGHVEILHCLQSMQTPSARRELTRLAQDPVFGAAMRDAAIRSR